ncbi:MBL fold metallo-hydrolase [Paenibacillus qinlingensis]|uniref:Cft2 family RNA processing exonuclease n=1 Tax=Paenibacillus qinlingensis TaxID=1837343 RepID=A0ABU1P301_9BACL|nr:MBL fold metallo-hydrolase [Paenibacillus qinlingensis]MDR6554125.1 Cft2 family RNA processing exonuclease [Paenibacillus qinlingensis]
MMHVEVWGGAGEHGRSCYWIGNTRSSIMLDCGVKREGIGEYPLLDAAKVAALDAVFLSHAHEDHSIAIPLLYKLGYTGVVWTTRVTAEQLPGYYSSWGNNVRQQGGELPYDETHLAAVKYAFIEDAVPAQQWFTISPELRVCWGRSGHMLGSIWFMIELEGKQLFYSGDYSEDSIVLGTDTPRLIELSSALDGAILDAAYSTDTEEQESKLESLFIEADRVLAANGQLLLPVPVCGRGQELLLLMEQRYPNTPIRVEQELIEAMKLMLQHSSWLKVGMAARLAEALSSSRSAIISTDDDRERLLQEDIACSRAAIWITTDGMMQSVKAQWYYDMLRNHNNNGILITGHAAKGTTAHRLLALPDEDRGCRIRAIRYKIHQGLPDVRRMVQSMRSNFKLLVHAPKRDTDELLRQLQKEGEQDLLSLGPGARIVL